MPKYMEEQVEVCVQGEKSSEVSHEVKAYRDKTQKHVPLNQMSTEVGNEKGCD